MRFRLKRPAEVAFHRMVCLALCVALALACSGCTVWMADPWIASNAIGVVDASTPTDVRDDFYLAMEKDWLTEVKVPSDSMTWGSFESRFVEIEDKLSELCENKALNDRDLEIMRTFARIVEDKEARDRLGMEPVCGQARRILDIDSIEELTAYLTSYQVRLWGNYEYFAGNGRTQGESLIGFCLQTHPRREPRMLITPNRWYVARGATSQQSIDRMRDAAYLLRRMGVPEEGAKRHVDDVDTFERSLDSDSDAKGPSLDRLLEDLDPVLQDRIRSAVEPESVALDVTRDELIQCAGAFPIEDLLDAYGYGEIEHFQILEPLWLVGLGKRYDEDHLDQMKSHLLVGLMLDAQYYLDTDASKGVSDKEEKKPKDEVDKSRVIKVDERTSARRRTMRFILASMPEIATNAYVKYCYAPNTNERAREITEKVREGWRTLILQQDWLSDESKVAALAKLNTMDVYVGSPDTRADTSTLDLTGVSSPWEALYRIRSSRTESLARKVQDTNAEASWYAPLEVNAHYVFADNAFFIGCGFLGGELFDPDATIEEQLAVTGFVVAHEIGHAFDPAGVDYDREGKVRVWMSEEDQKAYEARAQRVKDFMSRIRPLGAVPYKGWKVAGETIADMAALKALMNVARDIDGFDYARFFESYCIMWKSVNAMSDLEGVLDMDKHPIDATRANVSVMQLEEFVDTYGVKPGDTMYLMPEERVSVW